MTIIVLCKDYAEFHTWFRKNFPNYSRISNKPQQWFTPICEAQDLTRLLSAERDTPYTILPGFLAQTLRKRKPFYDFMLSKPFTYVEFTELPK